MRTMQFQQSDRAPFVAEYHEVLAKNADTSRQLAQFSPQDNRLPKAPKIFSARRSGPDPGELLILFWSLAMVVSAVGFV